MYTHVSWFLKHVSAVSDGWLFISEGSDFAKHWGRFNTVSHLLASMLARRIIQDVQACITPNWTRLSVLARSCLLQLPYFYSNVSYICFWQMCFGQCLINKQTNKQKKLVFVHLWAIVSFGASAFEIGAYSC